MNWIVALETFLAIVKYGSFVKAAEALNISTPAITKRIQWLEHHLKSTLFKRTTRSLQLTEVGVILNQRAAHLLAEWDNLRESVLGEKITLMGEMHIVTSAEITREYLLPTLQRFMSQHPQLRIHLADLTRRIDFATDKVDLVIGSERMLANPDFTRYKRLESFPRHLYVAPSYVDQHGAPQSLAELDQHQLITFFGQNSWEFSETTLSVNSQLDCSNADMMVDAAIAGLGIIAMPDFLVKKPVAAQQLQQVLPAFELSAVTLCAFYPDLPYMPKKIATFLQALTPPTS